METTLLIFITGIFIITIYIAGYKRGKNVGQESSQQMIEFYERQIDKLIGTNEKDNVNNDYWRQDFN